MVLLTTIIVYMTIYMSIAWIIAQLKKDNSIVDLAWAPGFILVALYSYLYTPTTPRKIITLILILLWGIRLSAYLTLRNWGKKEDPRYTNLTKDWGAWMPVYSLIFIFLLQGALIIIVSTPIILINMSSLLTYTIFDITGITIWTIGFLWETIADYQLYRFLANPNNHNNILTTGIWSLSRHPNYFGESLIWWGFATIALSINYGYIGLISPLLITYLLVYVSGIPLIEQAMQNNPAYQKYKAQTPAFFPTINKIK